MRSHLLKLLIVLSFFVTANASKKTYPAIFAGVTNVAEDDVLNVRASPNYRSKKVGELYNERVVVIDYCLDKKNGKALWCKIHRLNELGAENVKGWVNANYLTFFDNGYVLIDGKHDCTYALRCKGNKCLIAYNPNRNKPNIIKTRWISRNRLSGTSRYIDDDDPNASGYSYCGNEKEMDRYYKRVRANAYVSSNSNARVSALKFVSILNNHFSGKNIASFMHPKKTITLSYSTHFLRKNDKTFKRADFVNLEKSRYKKLYWGRDENSEEKIYMSLYNYMKKLKKPHFYETMKVMKLKNLKGFTCLSKKCVGYEILWQNNHTQTDAQDWHGVVVILEKYQGKWYIVGLLRDRWTI